MRSLLFMACLACAQVHADAPEKLESTPVEPDAATQAQDLAALQTETTGSIVRMLPADPSIAGLYLQLDKPGLGMAGAQELRAGLEAALAEHLDEAAASMAKRPTAPGSESLQ